MWRSPSEAIFSLETSVQLAASITLYLAQISCVSSGLTDIVSAIFGWVFRTNIQVVLVIHKVEHLCGNKMKHLGADSTKGLKSRFRLKFKTLD